MSPTDFNLGRSIPPTPTGFELVELSYGEVPIKGWKWCINPGTWVIKWPTENDPKWRDFTSVEETVGVEFSLFCKPIPDDFCI
jgi:hypothetical protein